MLVNGKKISAVQKRGGKRVRNKRANKVPVNPFEIYKDKKNLSTIFRKKLGQYRIIINTDFNAEDTLALTMLAAWIKANEKYFDARSQFPFYGFITSETEPENIKPQRIREYLFKVAELLGWTDSEHHLFDGFVKTGMRIWTDGPINSPIEEINLVETPEMLDSEDFDSIVKGIDEIMECKPSNLFIISLRPINLISERPEWLEFLLKVPGVFYGQENLQKMYQQNATLASKFFNRELGAPLVYIDDKLALGSKMYSTETSHPKFFENLEVYEDGDFSNMVSNTMSCWNDYRAANIIEQLSGIAGFKNVDFDNYTSIAKQISPETYQEYKQVVDEFDQINLHSNRCLAITSPLAIIGMLAAFNTIEQPLFTFKKSIIDDQLNISSGGRNLYVMCSEKPVTKYVSFGKFALAALKIVE